MSVYKIYMSAVKPRNMHGTVLRKSKCMYNSIIVMRGCMSLLSFVFPCFTSKDKLLVVQSFISRSRGAEDVVSL